MKLNLHLKNEFLHFMHVHSFYGVKFKIHFLNLNSHSLVKYNKALQIDVINIKQN